MCSLSAHLPNPAWQATQSSDLLYYLRHPPTTSNPLPSLLIFFRGGETKEGQGHLNGGALKAFMKTSKYVSLTKERLEKMQEHQQMEALCP